MHAPHRHLVLFSLALIAGCSAGSEGAAGGAGGAGAAGTGSGLGPNAAGTPGASGATGAAGGAPASGGAGSAGASAAGTNSGGSTSAIGGTGTMGGASGSSNVLSGGSGGMTAGGASSGGTSTGGATGGGAAGGATASSDTLYAAPDGVDGAPGTLAAPTTLTAALTRIAAGGTIALRGGTYAYGQQITIEASNSGTDGKMKTLAAYMSEKPVVDFSSEPYGTGTNPRGLQVNGSYWHVVGLEVKGSADNGVYVAGKHDVIESCVIHGNRDTGLQIGRAASSQTDMADWPSDNLILNCESYDNYDAPPGSGENADGFAAKLTVGGGNVFRGCVSHNNIDDGWDLYTKPDTGPIGSVTIDRCVSHHNGTLTDGTKNDNGDRNGFKLGGEKIAVSHTVTRSIAYANGKNGFTWNSNPGKILLFNDLAFDNVEGNFKFGDSSTMTEAVFANDVSFWTSTSSDTSDGTKGSDVSSSNAFWDSSKSQQSINGKGLVVTAADFAAPLGSAAVTRNADGSLNLTAFRLAAGSDLVNAGVMPPGSLPFDAGSYYVGVPDLGAVESP